MNLRERLSARRVALQVLAEIGRLNGRFGQRPTTGAQHHVLCRYRSVRTERLVSLHETNVTHSERGEA